MHQIDINLNPVFDYGQVVIFEGVLTWRDNFPWSLMTSPTAKFEIELDGEVRLSMFERFKNEL